MATIFQNMTNLFRAGLPVVALSSPAPEELTTLEKIYTEVSQRLPETIPVYVWDLGLGLRQVVPTKNNTGVTFIPTNFQFDADPLCEMLDLILTGGESDDDSPNPFSQGIFVMLDVDQFVCGDRKIPEVTRRIKNLSFALKRTRRRLVLMGQEVCLPDDFQGLVYELSNPLPGLLEIREAVDLCIENMRSRFRQKSEQTKQNHDLVVELSPEQKDRLIRSCLGLSIEEILNALRLDMIESGTVDSSTSDALTRFKVAKLQRLNIEFIPAADVAPGGYEAFRTYAKQRTKLFAASLEPQVSKLTLPTPKGVMLVGPPGTGKTLLAKTVQHLWGIPALKVDLASMYAGVVGETEANFRRFIQIAEAIAPCVVVFDEIEKALSGATGNNGDSGVSRRMIGSLLQWMNDKTAPCYVMATANDVSELQAQYPEIFRKGRFDDIFYVGLPNESERVEIFANHLKNQSTTLPKSQLGELAALTETYTGAEIAKVVSDATLIANGSDRDMLIVADLKTAIAENPPQAGSNAARLAALQLWAKENSVRYASAVDTKESKPKKAKAEKTDVDVML